MASEESIVNKIIPVETIIEIANYLENQKTEYEKLFAEDAEKNKNLAYNDQIYEYKGYKAQAPTVQYTIKFKDGKELTEPDYNWFIKMLENTPYIECISFSYSVHYSANYKNKEQYEQMYLHVYTWFHENSTTIRIDGANMEEQIYKIHSDLRSLLENNEERYNKTIKNRNLRIQSFCLTIGFIFSYILYLILIGIKAELPNIIIQILNNKYGIILGQWFISALIGNLIGFPIIMAFYKNIIPQRKFSHYSNSSKKSVYVDNIDDYISHNEVQIGKFANSGKNRILIEKIYKVTRIIVVLQLLISLLLFFIIK